MNLKDQLTDAMKTAMKERQAERLSTIRQVRSAIKNKEIEIGRELDDEGVISLLGTLVKQRREAAQVYRENQRPELADKEEAELVVLQEFLPAQLTEAELRELIAEVIAETGVSSPKDLGKVMPVVMQRSKGKAEGKLVNLLVRELLQS